MGAAIVPQEIFEFLTIKISQKFLPKMCLKPINFNSENAKNLWVLHSREVYSLQSNVVKKNFDQLWNNDSKCASNLILWT